MRGSAHLAPTSAAAIFSLEKSRANKSRGPGLSTDARRFGHVHLPKQADRLDIFLLELLAIPNGRHDDQVDSVSQWLYESSAMAKWPPA
jgi:phage terminase large subunit-like protein